MKTTPKLRRSLKSTIIGFSLSAALLGGSRLALAQTADLYINTFATADEGNFGLWYGSGTAAWDGVNGNGSPAGSLAFTNVFGSASDTPCTEYVCNAGSNPWWSQTLINFSQYKSLQFDIKYDTTSDITIDQYNNLGTWPTDLTNSSGTNVFQPWAPAGYLSGSILGLEIMYCGNGSPAGPGPTLGSTNIPAAAATGWAHVRIPINSGQGNIDGRSGIMFHKWINQQWGIQNPAVARFWIDNVMLEGTAGPPPPPTLSVTKATPGLNIFAGLASDPNNRYNIRTVQAGTGANYSWISNATPVSYSFTISSFPGRTHPFFMVNQYFVPVPYDRVAGTNGTVGLESSPDWNEPTCIFMDLENYPDGSGDWRFRYKTNSPPPNGNGTYYSDVLAELRDPAGLLGTWTITFSNNTFVTMTSPTGLKTNFTFSADKAAMFADTNGAPLTMYHYVGARANSAANYGQNATISRVQIQGSPDTLDDNFVTDSSLDTGLWQVASASAASILQLPDSSNPVYWVNWTLPDGGFVLQSASDLIAGPWNDSGATPLTLEPGRKVLITTGDLPDPNQGFWRLIKR